jgi:ubiquinone/menaquinone biosynthesis C-methylase UbiE
MPSLSHRPTEFQRRISNAVSALRGVPSADEVTRPTAPTVTSRYESTWSPPTEAEAKLLIYNTESEESFEQGGLADFECLQPFLPGDAIALDLGCGIGRVARFVAPSCSRLWAVDVSLGMLDMARERLKEFSNVQFVHSEDVHIPIVPSSSVDLAYSFLVLQHVEREDAFLLLEELRRLLKPSGTVVLTFPNLLSDVYLNSFLNYAHNGAAAREPARARTYTPQEVERLMAAAGFLPEVTAEQEIRVVARPK